jgi:hypothetical protein
MMRFYLFFSLNFNSATKYRRCAEQFGRDCARAKLRDADLQRNRHSTINGTLEARRRQTHQHQPNTCRYVCIPTVYCLNGVFIGIENGTAANIARGKH